MVSERVSSSLCFTESSSLSAVHLTLTRSTSWPCWCCLLPSLADPYILLLSIYSQGWVTKTSNSFTATKEGPLPRISYCSIWMVLVEGQRRESGRAAPFGIPLETATGGRRRRVVWARVAPPARVGKIALRSVWYPAPQSCSEKENEVIPGCQSSVADFS